ncbi:MAG: HDOD domain-containing protein [Myxococcota bacterium]
MATTTDQAASSRILRLRLRAHFEGGVPEPPPWPADALRIVRGSEREDCEVSTLAALIRHDEDVTAHVLKLARTTMYLTREPVMTVEQAVRVLGFRAIREMTLISASKRSVFAARNSHPAISEIFRHSLGAGFLAREIARAHGWDEQEAFFGALLHRAGAALTIAHVGRLGTGLRPPTGELLDELVATYEPAMTEALATGWALPDGVRQGLAHWRRDSSVSTLPRPALVTQLADLLATRMAGALGFDAMREGLAEHPALRQLNLFPDVIEDLLLRREEFGEIVEVAS